VFRDRLRQELIGPSVTIISEVKDTESDVDNYQEYNSVQEY